MVGRYPTWSAITTRPVAAAAKLTTVAPCLGEEARPRVNSEEPERRSAAMKPSPVSGSSISA
jgi:hypothetical protein